MSQQRPLQTGGGGWLRPLNRGTCFSSCSEEGRTKGDAALGATSWATVPTRQSGLLPRPRGLTSVPLAFGAETASSWRPRGGANTGPSFPSARSALPWASLHGSEQPHRQLKFITQRHQLWDWLWEW